MAKKCFLSFHYGPDNWRVQQIKNIGSIEEQPILTANKWEEIQQKGDSAVKKWIDDNMRGKACLIVLIGADTASRPWVQYEIKKAWKDGLGVFGIYVHGLKDASQSQSRKGRDPFSELFSDGSEISGTVYDPPYSTSTYVYSHISENIEKWVEAAIAAR